MSEISEKTTVKLPLSAVFSIIAIFAGIGGFAFSAGSQVGAIKKDVAQLEKDNAECKTTEKKATENASKIAVFESKLGNIQRDVSEIKKKIDDAIRGN